MNLTLIAVSMFALLWVGYSVYGRFIARQYQLDDSKRLPSEEINDGVDFVPTKKFYLLGQHFSAIAAAGPIAGPILACQQFGWLPCLLWIGFGVIFIGAVHDFSSLIASIRHKAQSIPEIIRENMGRRAWLAVMGFIWISLIYVIVAFTDITASSFTGRVEELEGIKVNFERGGAVAAASIMYLLLSIVMGLVQKKWNPRLSVLTAVFVPATLAVVWLGTKISTLFILSQGAWSATILAYCFIASLIPVWLLLQPRGYLGGFVLYMAIAVGLVGILFGDYPIAQEPFKTWNAPGATGALFPFLFVTIACGACSGFHGLVCSGTTSKQIAKESDCHTVGYGAMLMEGLVAVIALATIMIIPQDQVAGSPGAIYGAGLGRFLSLIIGKENLVFAITFGAMAFSTFVFDTLDVTTRLGRYILQELLGSRSKKVAILATTLTVALPGLVLYATPKGSWLTFWILFGTSNQLLAALTFLGISVWLYRSGKPFWFTLAPMVFVMGITFWSLSTFAASLKEQFSKLLYEGAPFMSVVNGLIAMLLMGLAVFILIEASKVIRTKKISPPHC